MFKFYEAEDKIRVSPKNSYREDFAAISDMAFDNAPNVFLKDDEDFLEYEKVYGEKVFDKVDVRVDSVISPGTQVNLGDDFKTFIFKQDFPPPYVGQMFRWQNSYWIAINTNNFESVTISCVARRCNNVLRWVNDDGGIVEEPCILAYEIWEGTNYAAQNVTLTAGYIKLFCQKNKITNQIVPNKRFLFGNKQRRECYKVHGNGIRNFLNSQTLDDESVSLLEFTMGADYINKTTDDVENGIADRFENKIEMTFDTGDFEQSIGFSKQIIATVKNNGSEVYPELVWSTSDESCVKVDNSGNVELISSGNANVRCSLKNNESVFCEINITVTENISKEEYEVVISPNTTEIFEGEKQGYTCYLYKNAEKQNDSFEFTFETNIPSENFKFYVNNGNTFTVENIKKYMGEYLKVICQSGQNVGFINIELKGAW